MELELNGVGVGVQWVGGGDGGEEARGGEDLLTGGVVVDMKRGLSWS